MYHLLLKRYKSPTINTGLGSYKLRNDYIQLTFLPEKPKNSDFNFGLTLQVLENLLHIVASCDKSLGNLTSNSGFSPQKLGYIVFKFWIQSTETDENRLKSVTSRYKSLEIMSPQF